MFFLCFILKLRSVDRDLFSLRQVQEPVVKHNNHQFNNNSIVLSMEIQTVLVVFEWVLTWCKLLRQTFSQNLQTMGHLEDSNQRSELKVQIFHNDNEQVCLVEPSRFNLLMFTNFKNATLIQTKYQAPLVFGSFSSDH